MKNYILSVALSLVTFTAIAQQNMLDSSTWTAGIGSVPGFNENGTTDDENVREVDIDPFGNSSMIWKAVPDGGNHHDGGWGTPWITIDNTKSYRFTIWLKKENSQNGRTYFGAYGKVGSTYPDFIDITDGSLNHNFLNGWLPQLGQWYLVVGFIHKNNYTGTVDLGGIYDTSGIKVRDLNDFKFSTTHEQIEFLNHHNYNTVATSRQFSFDPTMYEVNGLEPTISELINPTATTVDTTSPSIPTGLASNTITTTTATLSWSAATDNIGVTAYEVYKNNSLQATITSGTSYAITGLTAGTAYSYTVKAKDAAGNTSAQSTVLTITTLSSGGTPTTGGHWTKTGTVVSYNGGKVGIGTASPDYELTVKGKIHAEEVKIDLSVPAPDYVFKKEYKLLSLEEVQAYINKNGHLPNIPSAKMMETEGVELGAMEMKLLEKIEELTLYILAQKKEASAQKSKIMTLEERLTKLESILIQK